MEIMAVMAVISLLIAISVPVYSQMAPTIKLNSVTRAITSDLRYAQQLAVTQQINHAVFFDLVNNSYFIINLESQAQIKTVEIENGVSIQNISDLTDNQAIFGATGAVVEAGQITLLNQKNDSAIIELKPSGYVQIKR